MGMELDSLGLIPELHLSISVDKLWNVYVPYIF